MLFTSILMLTTLGLAVTAEYFSVYGLANMFSAYFWPVVCMGVVLAAGKFVAVSYLYRYWQSTGWVLRSYLVTAICLLMLNTSMGIFGYLSAGYQSDTAPLKQNRQQVVLLEQEIGHLHQRKREIDNQIAQLSTDDVEGRQRLNRVFYQESSTINKRIPQLTQEIQVLKMKTLEVEAHIGPIVYIADAFGLSTDNATKYIILLLIFVFEPLAVVLSICLNVVVFNRPSELSQKIDQPANNELLVDALWNDQYIQQRPPFDDIVFDLVTNPVPNWTLAPSNDQQWEDESVMKADTSVDTENENNDQKTIEPEPTDEDKASLDSDEKLVGTVFEIIEENEDNKHQPPSREIPRDSILDRWLKRRNQQ